MMISLSTIVITCHQASAGTPSAHISITVWIDSSVNDEIVTLFRENLTKYISPLGSWHLRVADYVSPSALWTGVPPSVLIWRGRQPRSILQG